MRIVTHTYETFYPSSFIPTRMRMRARKDLYIVGLRHKPYISTPCQTMLDSC